MNAELEVGPLSPDAFAYGTSAGDADDRIVFDEATGRIFYDPDGTGSADAVLLATVPAGTAVTNQDFIVF